MRQAPPLLADALLFASSVGVQAAPGVGDDIGTTAEIVQESEPSIALVNGKASMGTGWLARAGWLVTNAHVVNAEFIATLEVTFPSAEESKKGPFPAELGLSKTASAT